MKKGNLGYYIIAGILIIGCAGFFIGRGLRNKQEVQQDEEVNDTRVSISDAYNVDELAASKYDNLEIPKSLDITRVEKLSNMNLKQCDIEDYNRTVDIKFFQDNIKAMGYKYDEKCVIDDNHKTVPYGRYYVSNDEDGVYIATGHTGFFSVQFFDESDYEIVEDFYVLSPYEDKEYDLIGGSLKVSEAVELYENLEKKYIDELGYDIPVPKVYRVSLLKNEAGEQIYGIEAQSEFDGVPVFEVNDTYARSGLEYYNIRGSIGEITGPHMTDKNNVTYQGTPREIIATEPIDKIICIKEAADILNRKLSGYKVNTLKNIRIEYLLFEDFKPVYVEDEEEAPEMTYHAKPYWVFVFDSTTDNEIIGLVDCVTGEVGLVYNQ